MGYVVVNDFDFVGIGVDIVVDLVGIGRSEVNWVVQVVFFGEGLQLFGNYVWLVDYGVVEGIEVEYLVYVVEGYYDFVVGCYGCGGEFGMIV